MNIFIFSSEKLYWFAFHIHVCNSCGINFCVRCGVRIKYNNFLYGYPTVIYERQSFLRCSEVPTPSLSICLYVCEFVSGNLWYSDLSVSSCINQNHTVLIIVTLPLVLMSCRTGPLTLFLFKSALALMALCISV